MASGPVAISGRRPPAWWCLSEISNRSNLERSRWKIDDFGSESLQVTILMILASTLEQSDGAVYLRADRTDMVWILWTLDSPFLDEDELRTLSNLTWIYLELIFKASSR